MLQLKLRVRMIPDKGPMSCWTFWNEISLLLHRKGEPDASSTTERHLFICRGAGSKSSPVMMRHHDDIMPTQVDRESAAEDPPSQCVAVAAPSVADFGRVA